MTDPEILKRREAARMILEQWRADRDRVAARRDPAVRLGHEQGLNVSEIFRATGIARTTIYDILTAVAGQEGSTDVR